MAYWACARLEIRREQLALHCLRLAGYQTYYPCIREQRTRYGRRVEARPALFPGYAFVLIELQWHAARWAPGTLGLIMDGMKPARVPDAVIAEIRQREVRGLVELPSRLRRGDRMRILRGPFRGHLGVYSEMKPRERVEVLLQLLGGAHRVELARGDVVAARS
jgi:transcriptional antiterminator RfaH